MSVRTERLEQELDLVRRRYGEIDVDAGLSWMVVKRFDVPAGWTERECSVLVQLPAGYPTAAPDNFGMHPALELSDGRQVGNTMGTLTVAGRTWLMFSWHSDGGTWRPHEDPASGDNMLTFLEAVADRLAESS